MPDADNQLQFVPAGDVQVISGNYFEGLASYLKEEFHIRTPRAFVVVRKDTGANYVFGALRFSALAKRAVAVACDIRSKGPTPDLLVQLADIFGIDETSSAKVVLPTETPSERAVQYYLVRGQDEPVLAGVWVPSNELPASTEEISPTSPVIQDEEWPQWDAFPTPVLRERRYMPAPRHEDWDLRRLEEPNRERRRGTSFGPPSPRRSILTRGWDIIKDAVRRDNTAVSVVPAAVAPDIQQTLRRTPHMDLSTEEPVAPGATFEVFVYADTQRPRLGELSQDMVWLAPQEIQEFPITVYLCVTDHFAIKGSSTRTLLIRRDELESQRVSFSLQVAATAPSLSAGTVLAAFEYNSRPCGYVSRSVVVGPALVSAKKTESMDGTSQSLTSDGDTEAPSMQLVVDAQPADMTITILNPSKDFKNFDVIVKTSLLESYKPGVNKPWTLPDVSSAIVQGHFEEFIKETNSDQQRFDALKGAGEQLFESAPDHFRKAFWQIIDNSLPLKTILIVSDEPFIPWELMIPSRVKEDGTDDVKNALGVTYSVGRWITGQNVAPIQRFSLTECRVVAPEYDGNIVKKLPKAEEEANFVMGKFKGKSISPAIYAAFTASMKAGGAPLLHFICHGAASTAVAQRIHFENSEIVTSTQFRGNQDLRDACRKKKPLVFLNACEVGRLQPALVGVGGFAQTFINRGAQAVIAPLWSVKDDIAHEIAQQFYEATEKQPDKPFAEIIRDVRAKAYDTTSGAEDTYAAYCFYGDPLACRATVESKVNSAAENPLFSRLISKLTARTK